MMKTWIVAAALAALPLPSFAQVAQDIPAAIFTDPPVDKAYPAAMEVVHIPSGKVAISGIYVAAGAGPHPTVILCHGLPGIHLQIAILNWLATIKPTD